VTSPSDILTLTQSRAPTLHAGRVIAIDGPSGSGKTTLGDQLGGLSGARVIHLDDLYDGWPGLHTGVGQLVEGVLVPLAAGVSGTYRRYDWHTSQFAETVLVAPAPLLIVEGVGAGAGMCTPFLTTLIWVEAPLELRLEQAVVRDGEHLRQKLLRWQDLESGHHESEKTRDRADLVISR
jgi:uridine kinase